MFAVRAARLFDGRRLLDRPTLLIDGTQIVAAGAEEPEGIDVVDLGGDTTVLPGLIDCHQHLCFDGIGTLQEQVAGVDDEALLVRARASAQRALAGGVTSLRDLGDRNWVTLGLRGAADGPTILAAGPPITRPDGHCWFLGGGCSDAAGLRAAVRERVERGCDVVKVMATGGALTAATYAMWDCQFSTAELRLVVDAAHRAGLPVASHCHAVEGIERSLDAGVDSLEHCTFFTDRGRAELDDRLLERVAASGVTVSATIGRVPGVAVSPLVLANEPTLREARARLHELGATLVAGTDAGINPAKPHDVLPHTLRDLVAAGLSPLEGLTALTSVAATACGIGADTGRLERGFDADVIAVDGDPFREPERLTAVIAVWKGGCRIR